MKRAFHSSGRFSTAKPRSADQPTCDTCLTAVGPLITAGEPRAQPIRLLAAQFGEVALGIFFHFECHGMMDEINLHGTLCLLTDFV